LLTLQIVESEKSSAAISGGSIAVDKISRRVLVVEDDQRILRFLRLKLMAAGHDVVTAMTGQGALTTIESENPDIVVLDLRLPGMDDLKC
jgi:CheY-like chemotaxis protein